MDRVPGSSLGVGSSDAFGRRRARVTRLITAVEATGSSTRLDAALELLLAPDWHTYWHI